MNPPTTARRNPSRKEELRKAAVDAFWEFSASRALLQESERLRQIKAGVSAQLSEAIRITFDLPERCLETLLHASSSTLKRRRREQKPLKSTTSERVDRIAEVCFLAERVFLSRDRATRWMSKPNIALGGNEPIMLCITEIGGQQVRRALQALEWGGVA